ncbi:SHOCT domain-containing protein [Fodinibius sp. AD559]|uniref:SHOCT domain-containing protein n=1 Tax=Fodinibius sp. AD559 TaxID=3424179 RepID=UPI004046AF06
MFFDHHFIGIHLIWWLFVIGITLLLVFNIIPYRPNAEPKEDALEILKKRFARGEIEREEFKERKQVLKQSK